MTARRLALVLAMAAGYATLAACTGGTTPDCSKGQCLETDSSLAEDGAGTDGGDDSADAAQPAVESGGPHDSGGDIGSGAGRDGGDAASESGDAASEGGEGGGSHDGGEAG
jgi:hypothetical protein